MSLRVACYVIPAHRRSTLCAQAMRDGILACGDFAEIVLDNQHSGVNHDVCVFYGFTRPLQRIMADYKAKGRPAIYIDLGYWGRVKNDGHHKIVVNGRHPTEYFQRVRHDNARARKFGLQIEPWRADGRHILIAGMGSKASVIAENLPFESFERDAIRQLKQLTDRPIVYRPKPSCKQAGEIVGTTFSPPEQPLEEVLRDCHAVVTHHSNVAVDAVLEGIPVFCAQGVASVMGLQDLAQIETPARPAGRESWVNDISYTQWTWTEMARGLPWRHLKDEGLIPS
jgi:hypothetical protein